VFLETWPGAAQPVGLFRGEAGGDDGDLHRLFLEQRHAQRLAEHLPEFGRGKAHRLLPFRRLR
jgi:hypothetical protein